MTVALLNLVGLVVTAIAAFMMWCYPPRMAYYNEKGEQVMQWTSNAQPQKERIGKLQTRLSKWASFILAIGFALQFPSAIVALSFASTAFSVEENYFSCAGVTGVADNQSTLPLLNKVITSNESKVTASMLISSNSVTIEGIPYLATKELICENTDQTLWFNPSGTKTNCSGNDIFRHLGVFNKTTGALNFHIGDVVAILQCKSSKKLMK